MSKYTMSDDTQSLQNGQARFTVFGVGGGGGNAVEHMVQQGVKGVTFVCANTDRQALDRLTAPNKLQLGANSNRGLGAGANPAVGRETAEEEEESIRGLLEESDMVFITAGMGGGTGTGAAPVVARIAKEMEILTVAVVTTPFKFEGGKRIKVAKAGIEELSQYVDSIITIPNDKLMKVYGNISMQDAFKKADDVLLHAVQGIAETIAKAGLVNIDFNDIRTAMTAKGHAMMGIGRAGGDDRARQATEKAIRSPLLDDLRLENAKGLLVNVTSSSNLSLEEFSQISEIVEGITDTEEANIFYGSVVDEEMGEDLLVTVIATGLTIDDSPSPSKRTPTPVPSASSTQGIDPSTHTSALNNKRAEEPAKPQGFFQKPEHKPEHKPEPKSEPQAVATSQPKKRTTNSITDYLRSQQNK